VSPPDAYVRSGAISAADAVADSDTDIATGAMIEPAADMSLWSFAVVAAPAYSVRPPVPRGRRSGPWGTLVPRRRGTLLRDSRVGTQGGVRTDGLRVDRPGRGLPRRRRAAGLCGGVSGSTTRGPRQCPTGERRGTAGNFHFCI